MAERTLFCPSCAEILPPGSTACPRCGEHVQYDADEIMMDLALKARKKSIIPWGLILFFAIYLVCSYTFVTYYTKTTPEYKAAVHFDRGDRILGDDDGLTAETPALMAAFDEYIAGSKLTPRENYGQMRIETIMRRLDERRLKLSDNQQRELNLVARLQAFEKEKRRPVLFIGARDIWDIDSLEQLPLKFFMKSLYVAVFILIIWSFRSWRIRKHYDQMASKRIEEKRVERMNEKEYKAYIHEKRRKLKER